MTQKSAADTSWFLRIREMKIFLVDFFLLFCIATFMLKFQTQKMTKKNFLKYADIPKNNFCSTILWNLEC
jgi:hypothetical protein